MEGIFRFFSSDKIQLDHTFFFRFFPQSFKRSLNPVSLLFDSLVRPGADLGAELPTMLEYKYKKEKEVI